jgi:uncharacterized protein (DUF362 family)
MTRPWDAASRRELLLRAARAGIGLSVTGSGAWFLHRRWALAEARGTSARLPDLEPPPEASAPLPDWRIPGTSALAAAKDPDRARSFQAALATLGGMEAFVRPGERVLVKVNAAFASPPALGATTHPTLVTAVVQACLRAGASRVTVVDWPVNDPTSCFTLSGIGEAATRAGATLAIPTRADFAPYTLRGARVLRDWPLLLSALREADRVLGVAPVKDHFIAGASLSVKNWYGFLGGSRNRFHQDIHALLVDLAALIRPTLVVLDGTTPMLRNGPTGGAPSDLGRRDLMIVSTDPIAADALALALLDKDAREMPYLQRAQALGLGTTDWSRLARGAVPL